MSKTNKVKKTTNILKPKSPKDLDKSSTTPKEVNKLKITPTNKITKIKIKETNPAPPSLPAYFPRITNTKIPIRTKIIHNLFPFPNISFIQTN